MLGIALAGIIAGCALEAPMDTGGSPQDPPLPRTPSILPLQRGNRWVYSDTHYGATGNNIISREELNLEIPGVFGLSNGVLVELDPWGFRDTFPEYVYKYEWEQTDSGYLLSYRDLNVAARGVYIVGEYNRTAETLYASPILWLAYPADSGSTWEYLMPGSSDTIATRMEVLSTNAQFYFPDTTMPNLSAARFFKCCLYKQSKDNAVSYYYYHESVGALGYLRYVDGALRRTYILKAFDEAR
jgi:hypothetical protein